MASDNEKKSPVRHGGSKEVVGKVLSKKDEEVSPPTGSRPNFASAARDIELKVARLSLARPDHAFRRPMGLSAQNIPGFGQHRSGTPRPATLNLGGLHVPRSRPVVPTAVVPGVPSLIASVSGVAALSGPPTTATSGVAKREKETGFQVKDLLQMHLDSKKESDSSKNVKEAGHKSPGRQSPVKYPTLPRNLGRPQGRTGLDVMMMSRIASGVPTPTPTTGSFIMTPTTTPAPLTGILHRAPLMDVQYSDPNTPIPPVSASSKTYQPMAAISNQFPRVPGTGVPTSGTAFSPNYQGEHTVRNASARIPDELNCSLWITNLPGDVSYTSLLANIRGFGRIYATVINPPDGKHETSAAKVVFFERTAAQKFFVHANRTTFRVGGRPGRVSWNRIKSCESAESADKSRVLLFYGTPSVCNREYIVEFFASKFKFDIDGIFVRNRTDEWCRLEVRFGSYRCQSEAAKMALARDLVPTGHIWDVKFGLDPCAYTEEEFGAITEDWKLEIEQPQGGLGTLKSDGSSQASAGGQIGTPNITLAKASMSPGDASPTTSDAYTATPTRMPTSMLHHPPTYHPYHLGNRQYQTHGYASNEGYIPSSSHSDDSFSR